MGNSTKQIVMKIFLILSLFIPSIVFARDIKINDNYYIGGWEGEIKLLLAVAGPDYCVYNVSTNGVDFEMYIGQSPSVDVDNGSARLIFKNAFPIFLTSKEKNGVSAISITRVYAFGSLPGQKTGDEEHFYQYVTAHFLAESEMAPTYKDSVIYFLCHVVRCKYEAVEE